MERTQRTIILGAGASAPFGYPTGGELIDQISELLETLSQTATGSGPAYKKFTEHFQKFMPRSIDEYLSLTQDIDIRNFGKN